jgi:hypothetical protein
LLRGHFFDPRQKQRESGIEIARACAHWHTGVGVKFMLVSRSAAAG